MFVTGREIGKKEIAMKLPACVMPASDPNARLVERVLYAAVL
jgi:hypothetical protein